MSVAELETHRIITHATHSCHRHAGEPTGSVAAPALAKDVHLPHVLRARGKFPQELGPQALFMTVLPGEGDEVPDDLKVAWRPHGTKVDGSRAGASGYVSDDLDSVPPLTTLPSIMAGVGKLLKQAQKMQRGIAEAQQQLSAERLEVSHGGGAIRVTVDGHGLVHGLAIDPEFLKEDKTVVEQALVLALQEASAKARALHEATMSKATAGFSLPGM